MTPTALLQKIERAGFHLSLGEGGWLHVSPADRLNDVQKIWIRRHRQLLVDVLAAMDDPFVRWMLDRFDAEIVAVAKELP